MSNALLMSIVVNMFCMQFLLLLGLRVFSALRPKEACWWSVLV